MIAGLFGWTLSEYRKVQGRESIELVRVPVRDPAEVLEKNPCNDVLSDKFGNERHIADALKKRGIDVNLVQRVRAESNPAVAAASILARERFLTGLERLSKEAGVKLPKGAGEPVIAPAKRVYREGGREALAKVAKLHFKTTLRITSELF